MKAKYDPEADAIYIYLSDKPYHYGKDLDDLRRTDFAFDGTPIGVELLSVSKGVNMDGLPKVLEIARCLKQSGIRFYEMERQEYSPSGNMNNTIAYEIHPDMNESAEHYEIQGQAFSDAVSDAVFRARVSEERHQKPTVSVQEGATV